MKIAIPITEGKLSLHFGHCEQFDLLNVDVEKKVILGKDTVTAPPHEPGLLPRWLAGYKVDLIIGGGMGMRAKQLFDEQGIQVVVGAPSKTSDEIIKACLNGTLQCGANACDH